MERIFCTERTVSVVLHDTEGVMKNLELEAA